MSEITKLYENAGVEKEVIPCPAKYYGYDCTRNNWDDEDCSCDIEGYPQFTAEKQLEILCFIVNNKHSVTFHDQVFRGDKLTLEKIQENLAWAINRIWQDLTSEEKQQVKGILE